MPAQLWCVLPRDKDITLSHILCSPKTRGKVREASVSGVTPGEGSNHYFPGLAKWLISEKEELG